MQTLLAINNLVGVAGFVFGIAYAIWGNGPDMPRVPPFWRALARLIYPFCMLGLALIQSAERRASKP